MVDRSTSMKENRLEIVKRNILNIFDRLTADDVFSLITFNDRAEVVIPSTTAANLPSLKKSILGLSADGGNGNFPGFDPRVSNAVAVYQEGGKPVFDAADRWAYLWG